MADFVPELLGIGVDMIICACLYKAIQSTNNLIRDLKSSPQIPIDENMHLIIQNHPSCVCNEDTKTIPYATIRGDVMPMEKALDSNYATDMIGVIQKVAFTEHKRKLNKKAQWVNSQHTIAQYTNDTPFCLTDSQAFHYFVFEEPWRSQLDMWTKNLNPTWDSISALKRPHVEIMNWSQATRIDLDTVFDQLEGAEAGKFGKYILGSVVGDMHTGVQTIEDMLTKGTTLTGIGELVSGPEGIILKPPQDRRPYYLVKNSLSSLIKEVEGSRSTLRIFMKIFIGIGVIISSAAMWKLFKKFKLKESKSPLNLNPSGPNQKKDLSTDEQTDSRIDKTGLLE